MRKPINVAEIYSGLERIWPQLSMPALSAVSSVLRSASPELLRLCFLPLCPGEPVELHRHSLYARAATYTASQDEGPEACFWIAFERSSGHEAPSELSAAEVQMNPAFDLANLLDAFHFFGPLTCTSEIRQLDPCLARQITAIQRLRPVCGAEVHGDQLSLHSPVVIACSVPDTVHLTGLSPLDSPPSDHIRYRMAAAGEVCPPIVVLGERPITIEGDPTVRLTRVR